MTRRLSLLDIGPGAGIHGGNIIAQGFARRTSSTRPRALTGDYLSGRRSVGADPRAQAAEPSLQKGKALTVIGAKSNNLTERERRQSRSGFLPAITGVSGGGKSSLLIDTLYKAVARKLNNAKRAPRRARPHRGASRTIDKIIDIDQSPIGRTPRSNPATYTGAFTPMREWYRGFAGIQNTRLRGRAAFPSTSKAGAAKSLPGRRRSSKSKCTSCPTSTSPAKTCQGQALQIAKRCR